MGGHFGFAGAKLLHANRGQLPPPRSIWVIPGSRGVFGIEEVGVGPLMSDFFFTEFSNRALRGSIRRKEEFGAYSFSKEFKDGRNQLHLFKYIQRKNVCLILTSNFYVHMGIKFIKFIYVHIHFFSYRTLNLNLNSYIIESLSLSL